MSLMSNRSRSRKQSTDAHAPKTAGATKYKVIDNNFVEAVTPREGDGNVVVIIRRGSLDLPSPEKSYVDLPREDAALA